MARRGSPTSWPTQGKLAVKQRRTLLKPVGSDTSRRQFDRERDAAELATDVADDRCIRIRQNDGAAACRRALHEELDRRKVKHLGGGKAGVGRRALERGKAVNVFALDTQYFPAGDQDMKLRQLGKKPFRQSRRLRDEMLGVIQDQQNALAAQMADQARNRIAGR